MHFFQAFPRPWATQHRKSAPEQELLRLSTGTPCETSTQVELTHLRQEHENGTFGLIVKTRSWALMQQTFLKPRIFEHAMSNSGKEWGEKNRNPCRDLQFLASCEDFKNFATKRNTHMNGFTRTAVIAD